MKEPEFYRWKAEASAILIKETEGMAVEELLAYWQRKEAQREETYKRWRKGTAVGSHWNDDMLPWDKPVESDEPKRRKVS
jgi:hypothetical protein